MNLNEAKKIIILLSFGLFNLYANESGIQNIINHGWYIGAGTGFNVTANYNLIKTYQTTGGLKYQNLGNVVGYSVPIYLNTGYRFNKYLASELTYTYSGNQSYQQPVGCLNCSEFWGSQNYFGLTAVGFFPINSILDFKIRGGLAAGGATMTTYVGNPGTRNFTSELGMGLDYKINHKFTLGFDYINYGLLIPLQILYQQPINGGPKLGVIDTINENLFIINLQYHF